MKEYYVAVATPWWEERDGEVMWDGVVENPGKGEKPPMHKPCRWVKASV